ncbi:MAG: very short patch repair endonuclease [Nitrospirae bacterium]|nr:very short patch repair endonuclease [Nitrospirota bacterium]
MISKPLNPPVVHIVSDTLTEAQRSYCMSRVKSKGTSIEKKLGKALWAANFRYRKNYVKIYGTPDFVSIKYKIVIFCDSAFWHGYKNMTTKVHNFKSNEDFWVEKMNRNIQRDKEVNSKLKIQGWTVIRFWDFQIKKDVNNCVREVLANISVKH